MPQVQMSYNIDVTQEQLDAIERQEKYEQALGLEPFEVRREKAMADGDARARQFAWQGGR
jgi:PP-loop superfamily ATP-utilizing enzyme